MALRQNLVLPGWVESFESSNAKYPHNSAGSWSAIASLSCSSSSSVVARDLSSSHQSLVSALSQSRSLSRSSSSSPPSTSPKSLSPIFSQQATGKAQCPKCRNPVCVCACRVGSSRACDVRDNRDMSPQALDPRLDSISGNGNQGTDRLKKRAHASSADPVSVPAFGPPFREERRLLISNPLMLQHKNSLVSSDGSEMKGDMDVVEQKGGLDHDLFSGDDDVQYEPSVVSAEDLLSRLASRGRILPFIPSHNEADWVSFLTPILKEYLNASNAGCSIRMEVSVLQFLLAPRALQNIKQGRGVVDRIKRRLDQLTAIRSERGSYILDMEDYDHLSDLPDFEDIPKRPKFRRYMDSPDAAVEKKVIALASSGKFSRAIDTILQKPRVVVDVNVLNKLRDLFPSDLNPAAVLLPVLVPDQILISEQSLAKVMHQKDLRGSGAGTSGMVTAHLAMLPKFPSQWTSFTRLINDCMSGKISSPKVRFLLCSGLAVPINEGTASQMKIRPIVPPEIIFKLVSDAAAGPVRMRMNRMLTPLQSGIGVSGGSEKAYLTSQAYFESDPLNCSLETDFSNAFGSLLRPKMFEELFKHPDLANIWRFVHWSYAEPNGVVVKCEDGSFSVLPVNRGGLQGDPLFPFLFSLTVQPLYQSSILASHCVDLHPTAVLDDFSVGGKVEKLFPIFDHFLPTARKLGLELNNKSAVVVKQNHPQLEIIRKEIASRPSLVLACGRSTKKLGSRFGERSASDDEFIKKDIDVCTKVILPFLRRDSIPKQIALLLIRHCVISRTNYLGRVFPPQLLSKHLAVLDDEVIHSVCLMVNRNSKELSEDQKRILQLPISWGGLGMAPTQVVAHAAFISAFRSSGAEHCPPSLTEEDLGSRYKQTLNFVKGFGFSMPMYEEAVRNSTAMSKPKLQHFIMDKFYSNSLNDVVKNCGQQAKARIVSLQQNGSSSCLLVEPKSSAHYLSNKDVTNIINLRLGLVPNAKKTCGTCGVALTGDADEKLSHVWTCAKIKRYALFNHNGVQRVLTEMAKAAGAWHVTQGPKFQKRSENDDADQPDLEVFFSEEKPMLVEISLTNPACKSNISENKSHVRSLSSARARERVKYRKYDHLSQSRTVVAAVAETFGAMGPSLLGLLKDFSKRITKNNEIEFNEVLNDWKGAISCAIQRGNAVMVEHCFLG